MAHGQCLLVVPVARCAVTVIPGGGGVVGMEARTRRNGNRNGHKNRVRTQFGGGEFPQLALGGAAGSDVVVRGLWADDQDAAAVGRRVVAHFQRMVFLDDEGLHATRGGRVGFGHGEDGVGRYVVVVVALARPQAAGGGAAFARR